MVTRRQVLTTLGAGVVAAGGYGYVVLEPQINPPPAEVGFELTPDELAQANKLLDTYPAIDVHAHPGRTFVKDAENLKWKLWLYAAKGSFEDDTVADMVAGKIAAASFSGVSDFPVLNVAKGGLKSVRPFADGEAWKYYQDQLANLREFVKGGKVHQVLEPTDIAKAIASGKPGAMFAMEGADFLDGKIERVATIAKDGMRMVTLVHYIDNGDMGDIITGEPVNKGLTSFGREAVTEMNANRIMIDLAHASEKTAFDAISISTHPVVATHTHIKKAEGGHPRFISKELAQAIVETKGYVGAWPAGIGISSLEGYVTRIVELVETLGVDHVAIGSDMDANYKPVFENYQKMPLIVGRLLRHGMSEADIAKIIGGNFMRVFETVRGAQA
ncbi:MAG: membrane dipeptidase [Rhizobiaceae bacterium]